MRVIRNLLLCSLTAVALPLAGATPAGATGLRPDPDFGQCHVQFSPAWTRIQGHGSQLSFLLRRSGLSTAKDRKWATGMVHRHDLFVVANNSGRTSPTHVWTRAVFDCQNPRRAQSRETLRESLRRDVPSPGKVSITNTTIAGHPAERASWTARRGNTTYMGVRLRIMHGPSVSAFDFTTDRNAYLRQADRIIDSLRFS